MEQVSRDGKDEVKSASSDTQEDGAGEESYK